MSSRPSRALLRALRLISPLYLKWALGFASVTVRNGTTLVDAWRSFQEGKTRLLLAFRHPYGDEPQVFSYLFDVLLKRIARRSGTPLEGHPHARFIHGYEVALWGGSFIRWLLPRIGAVPVYHVRVDIAGIKIIRSIIRDGPHPIALAPEGQVSYRSETVPRLETGTAQMGFWCAEELEKAGRNERVIILPLSIHHHFRLRDDRVVRRAIRRLELLCESCSPDQDSLPLDTRLELLELKILSRAEDYYSSAYGTRSSAVSKNERWAYLRLAALAAGESALAIHGLGITGDPNADIIQRVYRLRQECWDRIYSLDPKKRLSPLERALADRRAGEAWYAMRHMEFADIGYYLSDDYLARVNGIPPSLDRIAETVCNFEDLLGRLAGGNISNRSPLFRKRAVVVAANPIDITERFAEYKKDRRAAVDAVTEDMRREFITSIQEGIYER